MFLWLFVLPLETCGLEVNCTRAYCGPQTSVLCSGLTEHTKSAFYRWCEPLQFRQKETCSHPPCSTGRKKRAEGWATIPWGLSEPDESPNGPRDCGTMQDGFLSRRDLSPVTSPSWVGHQGAPVGRCTGVLRRVHDPDLVWPRVLVGVECLCSGARCTRNGVHQCTTVFTSRHVIRASKGLSHMLVAIDCICAVRIAPPAHHILPSIVN